MIAFILIVRISTGKAFVFFASRAEADKAVTQYRYKTQGMVAEEVISGGGIHQTGITSAGGNIWMEQVVSSPYQQVATLQLRLGNGFVRYFEDAISFINLR